MKVGMTGTRSGLNDTQLRAVIDALTTIIDKERGSELHHGDCVGADVELAIIAKTLGFTVVCHPPLNDGMRAFHRSDAIRLPFSYFARNRNIVDETEVLLVVPYQDSPQDNGGTWYTHDYAVKKNKPVMIFYPGRDAK
jgi:hypothetical protein